MDSWRLAGLLAGLLVAPLSGLLGSGCLFPSDEPYLGDRDYPSLSSVGTDPETGAEGVSRNPTLRFLWNQRVHPDALGTDTLYVTSGTQWVRCASRVDLLECATELRPQETLRADLLYRAVAQDLIAMGGGRQGEPVELVFTTGDASEADPAPEAPALTTLVETVFAPRCESCHSGFRPPADLDLSTEDAARAGLVARESLYRPGVPRVAPGRHASSYLMWKLLDLPGLWGDPMPPSDDPAWPWDRECGTEDPDLRAIAAWIDSLAP